MGGFCRDLCDGLVGQCRLCLTAPITRTKIYWFGGVTLFIILFIIILCVSLPSGSSDSTPSGSDALKTGLNAGSLYVVSQFSENTTVEDFLKNNKDLDEVLKNKDIKVQVFGTQAHCDSQYKDAVSLTLDQVDFVGRVIASKPPLKLALTSQQIRDFSSQGNVASLIQINGGHSLDLRLSTLRAYYKMGVRIVSIVSTGSGCSTPWSKAVTDGSKTSAALGDFGKAVVHEMNRLGILIDIAGADPDVQKEVIDASQAPVAAIGVGLKSAFDNQLNLDANKVVKNLADKKGLVLLTLDCHLLSNNRTGCSRDDFTKQLDEAITGKLRVGLGGTISVAPIFPNDLKYENMGDYFNHLYSADSKKYSIDFLKGFAGENFINVLKEVEDVAAKMKTEAAQGARYDLNNLTPDSAKSCYSQMVVPTTQPTSQTPATSSTTQAPSSTTIQTPATPTTTKATTTTQS